MNIAFGPWEPDSAGVDIKDTAGRVMMEEANNVFPSKTGYAAVRALAEESASQLPTPCLGLFIGLTATGDYVVLAGTATKLWKLVAGVWTDYSRLAGGAYNVIDGDYWEADQFGSTVVFANISNEPQGINIDTGVANFSNLGNAPKARYVATVGYFLVLGCLNTNNRMVINSALNDASNFTIGSNLCDQQEMPDGGRITGILGGEYGFLVQETCIRRAIFQPSSDQAFRYEKTEDERGATAPYSATYANDHIFFLSDDGFYKYGPTGLTPIGHLRINKWFVDNSDSARRPRVLAFVDPQAPRIGFAFHSDSAATTFDRVLYYDWMLDQFSRSTQSAQFWARLASPGYTLEGLDAFGNMETLPYSLDSRVWQGGSALLAAVTSSGSLAFLEGTTPLDATLRTVPMHLTPGRRTNVTKLYPIGNYSSATIAARIGRYENFGSTASFSSSFSPSFPSGQIWTRAGGRALSFEQTITQTTGTIWAHAEGMAIDGVPAGIR